MFFLLSQITLFVLATFGVRLYCHYASKKGLFDIPNERSSHETPVPRGGGVVFVGLWFVALSLGTWQHRFSTAQFFLLVPTTLMIALVGFLDDCYGLSATKRLLFQGMIGIVFLVFLGPIHSFYLSHELLFNMGYWALPLALIAMIWSINTYNFMDGLDGFSAVEAVFVLSFGGWLFWHQGILDLAFANWSLVACVLGFLFWNWPRARVFMGDIGSYALGFCVAAFALIADQRHRIPIVLWVILYGVFIFDATVTLLRRLWHKENITIAHCSHAYQRLYKAGVSKQNILIGLILLNSVLGALVVLMSLRPKYIWPGFSLALILLASVYWMIEKINPMWGGCSQSEKSV